MQGRTTWQRRPQSLRKALCASLKLQASKSYFCPGQFARGTGRCMGKYGLHYTVSQQIRVIHFDGLISKSPRQNPPSKFPKAPKWGWDKRESPLDAHQVWVEDEVSFHNEKEVTKKPYRELCQGLSCSETLCERKRMTKLVTSAKFSLHKAQAAKCWWESGQGSGQVKFNFGESKVSLESCKWYSGQPPPNGEGSAGKVWRRGMRKMKMSQGALWRGETNCTRAPQQGKQTTEQGHEQSLKSHKS